MGAAVLQPRTRAGADLTFSDMSQKANYFKLGLFVIGAVADVFARVRRDAIPTCERQVPDWNRTTRPGDPSIRQI